MSSPTRSPVVGQIRLNLFDCGGGNDDDGPSMPPRPPPRPQPQSAHGSRNGYHDDYADLDDDDEDLLALDGMDGSQASSSVDLLAMDTEDDDDDEDEDALQEDSADEQGQGHGNEVNARGVDGNDVTTKSTTTAMMMDDDEDDDDDDDCNEKELPRFASAGPTWQQSSTLSPSLIRRLAGSTSIPVTTERREEGEERNETTPRKGLDSLSSNPPSSHVYYQGSTLDPQLPLTPATRTLNELSQEMSQTSLWYHPNNNNEADEITDPSAHLPSTADRVRTKENQRPNHGGGGAAPGAPTSTTGGVDKRARPVEQLDPITQHVVKRHDSIRAAEIDTGIKRQRITEAARSNGTKEVGNFLWRFLDDNNNTSSSDVMLSEPVSGARHEPPPSSARGTMTTASSSSRAGRGRTTVRFATTNEAPATNGGKGDDPHSHAEAAAATTTAGSSAAAAATDPDDEPAADVPFCARCTTGRGRVHHAWCPKHPQFELSGAKTVLERLLLGAHALGCNTCRNEYKQGSRSTDPHAARCRQHTDAEAAAEQRRQAAAAAAEAAAAAAAAARENVRANELEAVSIGKPRAKSHRRRIHSDSRRAKSNDDDDDYSDHYDTDSAMSDDSRIVHEERAAATRPRKGGSTSRRSKSTWQSSNNSKSEGRGRGSAAPTAWELEDSETDEDSDPPPHVEWVDCENPWGPDEYQDGDVILFSGNTPGTAHIEALLPSPRFVIDPFVGSSPYRTTHNTPTEGFQVVRLRRDPMARLDWGFSAARHEFGGACLVTAVDALSPASSAVFVGAATETNADAALRVNDMIILINGKKVGGMMESVFDVEVEASGAFLNLILSRYKHAETVEDRLQAAERQFHAAVDDAINDPCGLGWVDLIATSRPRSSQPLPDSGRTPPLVQQRTAHSRNESHHSASYGHTIPTSDDRDAGLVFTNGTAGSETLPPSVPPTDGAPLQQLERGASIGEVRDMDVAVDDYPQACLGCVCGIIHDERVPVFWLQCDSCKSWYNVSPQCVMLNEHDAKALPTWVCWGCEAPIQSESAEDDVPVELGNAAPFSSGQEDPMLARLSDDPMAAVAPCHTATAEHHKAYQVGEILGNVNASASGDEAVDPQGHVGGTPGLTKRDRRVRTSSKTEPSTLLGAYSSPGKSPAGATKGSGAPEDSSTKRKRSDRGGGTPQQSHAQPSETFDNSVFWWKGRWVPVPVRNSAGIRVVEAAPKPVLTKGTRVLYREDGRPEHGEGVVKSTRIDDVLGRFYDVRLPGWDCTVKDVHEHFVDPIEDDE